ncbi:MAG: glycosyltransferase, partial [Candidatus Neomarinimicrobiota bacterium]
ILAGSTFPADKEEDGENYREFLEQEIRKLRLENHVSIINKYLSLEDLLRYINASDICITPYIDAEQVSSGILSFCVGLNKPVVSTPYLYAKEILNNGRGEFVEFKNPESISNCILKLLGNKNRMVEIKSYLTQFREHMRWSNVAKNYIDLMNKLYKG